MPGISHRDDASRRNELSALHGAANEQVVPTGNQPSLSKLYDVHMLVLYSGGRERTLDEYRGLLTAADLRLSRIIPTEVPRSVIEAVPR